jgi:hypothetical protein
MKLDKHIHRQQAPFSGAVRGTIDRDSISITFANIFSFFCLIFLLHRLISTILEKINLIYVFAKP